MSEHPVTQQRLVVQTPEMDRVTVERDIPFGSEIADTLRFDLYRPADAARSALPAVVFVTGYSDTGAREAVGRNLKDWAAYADWARLVASSGLVAITYSNEAPVRDLAALLEHVTDNADSLGIDRARLGIWSCSGNTATALAALHDHASLTCAALCYGYMIDVPGHDDVARAAAQFGFVNATAGMRIGASADKPILVVRAGRDEMPGLNASLDRFVAEALSANLPISVINHSSGAHAFDISESTEASRTAVDEILRFLTSRLRG